MKKDNSIEKIINDAAQKMREIADANMIVGTPVLTAEGTTIIPVSRVTVGLLSGGGEYGDVNLFKPSTYPNLGASGGVVSVKPSGFLVEKNNKLRYIHCPTDIYERAIGGVEELVKGINEKISKK